MSTLHAALASKFASLALAHVGREYPNKLDHVMNDAGDVRTPRELHPIFYGSFDWHSNVHGYWLLATLMRRVDGLAERERIRALFDAQLTPEKVAAEVGVPRATVARHVRATVRLGVAADARRGARAPRRRRGAPVGRRARTADASVRRSLPRLSPQGDVPDSRRHALQFRVCVSSLALEYATITKDDALAGVLADRALAWFGGDEDCQAWEPGGDDFLSSALMEAECMRRVLPHDEWLLWLDRFLPRITRREPATLFRPATVSDRTDGKIAHLDGLNLSRAWCWRSIASALSSSDSRHAHRAGHGARARRRESAARRRRLRGRALAGDFRVISEFGG